MRKVLHLHAGFHKTGTTAIQDYLFNADLDPEYTYFHTGIANSSFIMLQAFKQDISDDPQFRKNEFTPENITQIRERARMRLAARLSEIDQAHTILSAESIGTFTPAECADLYEFLKPYYDDIRVYVYIRPLKSRMESAFQENLKSRYRSLDERFPFRFETIIGKFDQCFGSSQVSISKFSRDALMGGDVVSHFMSQVGLDKKSSGRSEVNTSLSLPAIQLLYIYRKYFPQKQLGDPERIQMLASLPGENLHFHSTLFKALLNNPEGDLDWLKHRAGFSITEDIEADDHNSIRSERDLTDIPAESISWLKAQQGNFLGRVQIRDSNLRSIAMGVRRLRSVATITRLLRRQKTLLGS